MCRCGWRSASRLCCTIWRSARKHMNLNSCLEEILLHTCEPFSPAEGVRALSRGEGVTSPHTKKNIAYIQELKKKHGIDYECHASYRFVEKWFRAARATLTTHPEEPCVTIDSAKPAAARTGN